MAYGPRRGIRERQVIYGSGNAGKSTAMLTLARRYQLGHVHVLDADDAWEFMLYEDEEPNKKLLDRGNYTLHQVNDEQWDEEHGHYATLLRVEEQLQPGDIVIYDKVSGGWGAVQDWFDHKVFGMGHADYYVKMRAMLEDEREAAREGGGKGKRTAPLYDSLRDWGPINAQYRLLYATLYRINRKAHLFLLADAAKVGDNDDGDLKKMVAPFGGNKPRGQKGLFGFPHTVLYLSHDVRAESFEISQVKDRSTRLADEKRLDEVEWEDFTKTYLGPVAGWHMQKVD
jgi:hypothetical protein